MPAANKIHVKVSLSLDDESWERLQALAARIERAAAMIRHPSAAPAASDFASMADDVERLANGLDDLWAEPVCVICGATSATSNMFRDRYDGIWRCQEHHN